MNRMTFVEMNIAICKAFGIDMEGVQQVNIKLSCDGPPCIDIYKIVTDLADHHTRFELLSTYELVKREPVSA